MVSFVIVELKKAAKFPRGSTKTYKSPCPRKRYRQKPLTNPHNPTASTLTKFVLRRKRTG